MPNTMRKAWAEGKPSIGYWGGWTTPLEAERLGAVGYDWVVLDMQHSGLRWETLVSLMQAVELGGTRVIVRVAWNDPSEIMRALDLGAIGVIVPMVNNAEEAKAVATAVRYPPLGERSNGQTRRQLSYKEANEDLVAIVMVETAEGWEKREEIAAVEGIDTLIIGPSDLALTLGREPDVVGMHPDALGYMKEIVEVSGKHGKTAGTLGFSGEHVQALLENGVTWVSYNEFAGGNPYGQNVTDWKAKFAK